MDGEIVCLETLRVSVDSTNFSTIRRSPFFMPLICCGWMERTFDKIR